MKKRRFPKPVRRVIVVHKLDERFYVAIDTRPMRRVSPAQARKLLKL